ncbi:MAG: UpxY family transcription antiterminator [Fluviicola sp.]|nr:UpxY family transcription antiterminator [Fluviicola sp.]
MPWFVIYTKPRNEKKVTEQLLAIGIEAFCPMITTIKQWSDRKKKVTIPLINSYVFVQLDEVHRFKVFDVPGVVRYVHWLKNPAIVRDSEIEVLKELSKNTVCSFTVDHLKKGDEFLIPSGVFKDKKGLIEEVRGKSVKIKLDELGLVLTVQLED